MKYLRVKKWDQHQHYTDRDPPWIKVYNRLLDDFDFLALSEAAQSQLVKIWLLASRTDNRIPYDLVYITTKISAKSAVNIDDMLVAGWLELADVSEAPARPVKERKAASRKKKDRESKRASRRKQSASASDSDLRLETEERRDRDRDREEKKTKYPFFARAACDRLYAAWGSLGRPPYAQFRSAFGPLFPSAAPPYSLDQLERAIRACIEEAKTDGRTQFVTPVSFVARVQHWVDLSTPIAQRDPGRAHALGVAT